MTKNKYRTKKKEKRPFVQQLKDLLEEVSHGLSTNFNASYIWIGLIDETDGKMREVSSFGTHPPKRTKLAKLQYDVCKKVFENGVAIKKQKDVKLEISPQGKNKIQSILCLPIKIDKIERNKKLIPLTLGVLFLGSTEKNNFSREEETKIKTIAGILTYAIWNYNYEFGERFSKQFKFRIPSVNLHENISDGLEKIMNFFKADHGTLYRYDRETHSFFDVIAKGVSKKFWEHAVPRKDGVAAHVIKNPVPYTLDDVNQDPLFSNSPFTKDEGVKSTAATSLDGEGVLFLSYSERHEFSNIEKEQFKFFSRVISAVFRSLRLTEELKWGRKSQVSTPSPDWTEMLKLFFEKKLLKITDIDVIRLYNYDRSSDRYSLAVQAGALAPYISMKARKGGVVEHFAKGKIPIFYDKIEESSLKNSPITKKEGIKSAAVLPLVYGQSEVLGVLFVNYRESQRFTNENKGRLIGLVEFLALVLNSVSKDTELTRTINILQNLHSYKHEKKVEDIQASLQMITDGIAYLTKADLVLILMHLKKKKVFFVGGAHGIEKEEISKKFPLRKGIGRDVLDTEKEITKSNFEDHYPQSILYKKAGIRSVKCVPLIYANEIVGLLYWGYRSKNFPQPDYSSELLEIFYGEASQRIGNYLSDKKIIQKQKQLESLLDITKIVHASKLNLKKTLNEMTKIIADKLGYERGIVSLKEKVGEIDYFKRVAFIGLDKEEKKRLSKISTWNTVEQIKQIIGLRKEFRISNSYYIPSKYSHEVKRILSSVSVLGPDEVEKRDIFEWQPEDYLFIPLRKGGEIIGLLSVDEPVDRAVPTKESVKTLEIFAEHLVLAIENTKRYERRIEELEMLKNIDNDIINKIGESGQEAFGLQDVLKSIIEKSRIIGDVDYADIFLKDGEKLVRKANFTASELKDYLGGYEFSVNEKKSVVAYVTRKKKSVLIKDLHHKRWQNMYSPTYFGMKVELAVPMMQSKEVIGVINVESSKIGAFEREDQNYLEALAAQSVIAIQNANAYELKVQRLKDYDILQSIEKKIGSSLDLEEIVKHVLEVLVKNTNSEIAHISLWHKDTNALEILARHGIKDVKLPHWYRKGITILAAQRKEFIYVPDLDERCPCCEKGSWRENHFYQIGEVSIKSELGIPVIYDDNVLGVINLESGKLDAFRDHIPLVTFISSQIGRAIEQAKQHKKELKEKEGRVTRDLLGFIGQTMIHELNNSLAAIRGNLEALSRLDKDEEEKRKRLLKRNEKIISDILYEIERLPEETALEKFEIQDALNDIIDECKTYREYNQSIRISHKLINENIIVEANKKCMYIIIRNLLQNAFAAMPKGGELNIETKKWQSRVEIFVKDTGFGITEENQKKLFDSIIKSKKETGLGIFLMISKSLILSFKGDIELVESKVGKGTEFKLWLPLVTDG